MPKRIIKGFVDDRGQHEARPYNLDGHGQAKKERDRFRDLG